jgi:DHA2 family multidrug resistance protein
MTAATGLYNVVRQVSASIGIALAANQVDAGTHRYHDLLAEGVTMYDAGARTMLQRMTGAMVQAGADSAAAVQRSLAMMNGRVVRQAIVLSYNRLFQLAALLFVIALPLTLLLATKSGARGATPALPPPAPPRPMPRPRLEPVPVEAPEEVGELVGAGSR